MSCTNDMITRTMLHQQTNDLWKYLMGCALGLVMPVPPRVRKQLALGTVSAALACNLHTWRHYRPKPTKLSLFNVDLPNLALFNILDFLRHNERLIFATTCKMARDTVEEHSRRRSLAVPSLEKRKASLAVPSLGGSKDTPVHSQSPDYTRSARHGSGTCSSTLSVRRYSHGGPKYLRRRKFA